MFILVWSPRFTKAAKRFSKLHPELNQRFARILRDVERDPFQSHLRLHPLQGDLAGIHAISLTHSYRITLTLKITEHEIILLDIGSHDEVYG